MPSTSFSDMPTLAAPSSTSPSTFHHRRKSWARKFERCCCSTLSHFPLVFVYGLTSWAVYVEVDVSFLGALTWLAWLRAGLGILLFLAANISYTTAVFTGPGSPLDPRRDGSKPRKGGGYEGLPTYEGDEYEGPQGAVPSEWQMTSVTAKSTGLPRYCKKCKTVKPDRAHHCSTCGKCVLKMDHHCPWLATCVGLRNYKPFLLFLIYTCLFCWLCFAVSGWWVWSEIISGTRMTEGARVVNTILLSVLGGVIGLVLSGFTGWHLYLVMTGQTTIESLEKTRYLAPLRQRIQPQYQHGRHYIGQKDTHDDNLPLGERLKEIHANALPGVLRPEEGEISISPSRSNTPIAAAGVIGNSPAHESLRRSYASVEARRERDRYNDYLDEQDSNKLPNAFDLGRKRNFLHVFGDNPLCWLLPICNSSGDGWKWELSPEWTESRDRLAVEREQRAREDAVWDRHVPASVPLPPPPRDHAWAPGQGYIDQARNAPNGRKSPSKLPLNGNADMQMQPLDRRKDLDNAYEVLGDEEGRRRPHEQQSEKDTPNWNDIPESFLDSKSGSPSNRSRSQGRKKGD